LKTIFVSSTFKDMHYERDIIQEVVSPEVNKEAAKHGQSVSFCDLRWGIDTSELESESGSKKVLDVCLDEIDRSQPPMVVILGYKYGWIPSTELISQAAERKALELDELRKSVTALEIEYGALSDRGKAENTLFYFREIEGVAPDSYTIEDDERRILLEKLKRRIKEISGDRLYTYHVTWNGAGFDGMDLFAEKLKSDIIGMLEGEWSEYDNLSDFDRDRRLHESFMKEKSSIFKGRGRLVNRYLEHATTSSKPLILTGDSGAGKSTLLSYMGMQLKERGFDVMPIYSGYTTHSNSVYQVQQDIVYFFENKLNIPHISEDELVDFLYQARKNDVDTVAFETALSAVKSLSNIELWHEYYCILARQMGDVEGETVILIDAIDQLSHDYGRNKLMFLPKRIPSNLHYIITTLPEVDMGKNITTPIPDITHYDKMEMIDVTLRSMGREVSHDVIVAITRHKASAYPLGISYLIKRLMMMNQDDFAKIAEAGDGIEAISEYQISLVKQCPEELRKLGAYIIRQAGVRINPQLVEEVSLLISRSNTGLRMEDFIGILGDKFNTLDFAHFVTYMSDSFILRDDGCYDFSHKSIREGFRSGENIKERLKIAQKYTDLIYRHFYNLGISDPIASKVLLEYHIRSYLRNENGYEEAMDILTDIYKNGSNDCRINAVMTIYKHSVGSWNDKDCWLKMIISENIARNCAEDLMLPWFMYKASEYCTEGEKDRELEVGLLRSAYEYAEHFFNCYPEDTEWKKGLATYCRRLAEVLEDEAEKLELLDRGEQILQTVNFNPELQKIYLMKANIYRDNDLRYKFSEVSMQAEEYYKKALELCDEVRDLYDMYNNLADFLGECGVERIDDTIKYFTLAEAIVRNDIEKNPSLENRSRLANILSRLSGEYQRYETAEMYWKALELEHESNALREGIYKENTTRKTFTGLMKSNIDYNECFFKWVELQEDIEAKNYEALFDTCKEIDKRIRRGDMEEEDRYYYRYINLMIMVDALRTLGGDENLKKAEELLDITEREPEFYGKLPEWVRKSGYKYAEMYEVLLYMSINNLMNLSHSIRQTIIQLRARDYKNHIDQDKILSEQKLERETMNLLMVLFVKYLAGSSEEVQGIVHMLDENDGQKNLKSQ